MRPAYDIIYGKLFEGENFYGWAVALQFTGKYSVICGENIYG